MAARIWSRQAHYRSLHSRPCTQQLLVTDTVFPFRLEMFPSHPHPPTPWKEWGGCCLGLMLSCRSDVAVSLRDWMQCWMERVGHSAVNVSSYCSCGCWCLCWCCCVFVSDLCTSWFFLAWIFPSNFSPRMIFGLDFFPGKGLGATPLSVKINWCTPSSSVP